MIGITGTGVLAEDTDLPDLTVLPEWKRRRFRIDISVTLF